jgi:hypothetical protein
MGSALRLGLAVLAAAVFMTAAQAQATTPLLTWDGRDKPAPQTLRQGGLEFRLSTRPPSSGPATADRSEPVLDVTAPGAPPLRMVGEGDVPYVSVGAVRLDPLVKGPQVLFMAFSGGAHCCNDVRFAELDGGRWRVLHLGQWNGDVPDRLKDIDGDGRPDLEFRDDRYLYAFGCYACSYAPLQIIAVEGGKKKDVSKERRFFPAHRRELKVAEVGCRDHMNGVCAGYLAEAAILGRAQRAWRVMLDSYDKTSDWTLPTRCDVPRQDGKCPEGHEHAFKTYPEALEWFLYDTGYTRSPHEFSGGVGAG